MPGDVIRDDCAAYAVDLGNSALQPIDTNITRACLCRIAPNPATPG